MIWKLVFHIDEADKWPLVLGNIKNFLNGIGDQSYDINIVANAGAVTCISENGLQIIKEIQLLTLRNVQINFCKIALHGNNISENTVPNYIKIVPSGIKRIAELQINEGCAYIKP